MASHPSQHPMRLTLRGEVKAGAAVQAVLSIGHPMESGFRRLDSGETIPKHVIEQIGVVLTDGTTQQVVWEAKTGIGISSNPYLAFPLNIPQASAGKPWRIVVTWRDDKEQSGHLERELLA